MTIRTFIRVERHVSCHSHATYLTMTLTNDSSIRTSTRYSRYMKYVGQWGFGMISKWFWVLPLECCHVQTYICFVLFVFRVGESNSEVRDLQANLHTLVGISSPYAEDAPRKVLPLLWLWRGTSLSIARPCEQTSSVGECQWHPWYTISLRGCTNQKGHLTCSIQHRTTLHVPLRRLKSHWQPTYQHLGYLLWYTCCP